MKAVVYTDYGPPDVLHVAEVPQPVPKENEISVSVRATPVNFGDLIFDVLGKTSYSRVKHSFTPEGRYQPASFKMSHLWQMLRTSLFGKQKVICALSMEKPADLEQVRSLLAEGVLTTVVDRCFLLEAAAEAHAHAESGRWTGSVILTVGGYQCAR